MREIRLQLDKMPEGTIACAKNGSYIKWYVCQDGKRTYLPKRERAYAEQLAYKKYLLYLYEDKLCEKEALDKYVHYHDVKFKQKSQIFVERAEYKQLLSKYFTPLSEQLHSWMNKPYEHNTRYQEHLIHKTNANYAVRSKSEALIDMTLRANKIPFRYECALKLEGITLFPDFTIRHPKTGDFYYWEHFGRMDDACYSKNAYEKLQLYTSHGIVPTINLIVTIETQKHPLCLDTIENKIDEFFMQ